MAAPSFTMTLASAHTALDAKTQDLFNFDTGQELDTGQIDARQLEMLAHEVNTEIIAGSIFAGQHIPSSRHVDTDDAVINTEESTPNNNPAQLAVTFHEIHRIDECDDGSQELITSTLKYFALHLAVQDSEGDLAFNLDGITLVASLIYDDGQLVEELSATHEPPLLAAKGETPPKAIIEGGVAVLNLRITVLSSLCNKRSFRVRVASIDGPDLTVTTAAVKTITKLRRASRGSADRVMLPAAPASPLSSPLTERLVSPNAEAIIEPVGGACGAKRGFDVIGDVHACQDKGKCVSWAGDRACIETDCAGHTLDQLWDQVAANGARLLELQEQQRRLFKELRVLKYATPSPSTP